ncbi:MAG TPA: FAD-dependent monooxygenase [Acidobacteriaceae bacterium]|jgi:2-polyprenyl-6-methoxyphenol hydroxylase-like FAD-dependent oxidoreductase|nr:FAD-dependent monooxygenase [Acidobacteriaceae bacterium]
MNGKRSSHVDVLVAGAGPVGLTAAAELARFGLSVRIVDRAAGRTDKSKALVVWSRTLELLDRAGCGEALVAAGQKCVAANLMSGPETLAHVRLDTIASPHPYALMLPQSETERLLENQLGSLGVEVERSVELTALAQDAEGVACAVRGADGGEESIEAAWVVACDGAHSTVRHSLGLAFEGSTLASDWVLADVHVRGLLHPDELHLCFHEDGVLAIFPIGPGRFRLVANVGEVREERARPDPTLADVQALADRRGPGGLLASDPVWLSNFRINERKVPDYRAGRVFLAGDAAHVHSPAGGQGMNTGIQDACNLAWKLALVQRGMCAPEPLLSSYSAERSPVAVDVLKGTGVLTSVATLHNRTLQAVRNAAASLLFGLPLAQHKLAEQLTEVAVGYPHSPLNSHVHHVAGTPAAGERAPLGSAPGKAGWTAAGQPPQFALFAEPSEDAAALLSLFPTLIEPKMYPPFAPGGVWLVRPDGYIAVATRAGHAGEVATFLQTLTGDAAA